MKTSMVQYRYLSAGETMPEMADDELWLEIEASFDGRFFGTGCGRKLSGESVFYISLPEDDVNLKTALSAATKWAGEHGVTCIWVQTTPAL
ncbi:MULTISPECIES: hypothetical protein [Sphingosinicella]|uniref:hypothetical protein n=1 Tax=Sphingosinicella TaxID=335405 RepID=UPI000F81B124|nr:hypothetical protein [Sphingosinicella microcystinivorans]